MTATAITRYGTAPVLSPQAAAPFHETMASQAAVMREWNAEARHWDWYMYYSYRGKDGILPGLRLATSPDGKTWTHHYNEEDPRDMGQIFKAVLVPSAIMIAVLFIGVFWPPLIPMHHQDKFLLHKVEFGKTSSIVLTSI